MRVVPTLDKFKHGKLRLGVCAERMAINELAFERREEALTHRVVEAVADGAHGRAHAGLFAAHSKRDRGVLSGLKESSQHWFVEAIINDLAELRQGFSNPVLSSAGRSMSQRLH